MDGPGVLVQAAQLAELERSWDTAGGRLRHSWVWEDSGLVTFANRGMLLPFFPLPSVSKQIPQAVSYFSELHLGLTCAVGFAYLCARQAGALRLSPGARTERLLCYVAYSKCNERERLCIIPCICSNSESIRKLAPISRYAVIPWRCLRYQL